MKNWKQWISTLLVAVMLMAAGEVSVLANVVPEAPAATEATAESVKDCAATAYVTGPEVDTVTGSGTGTVTGPSTETVTSPSIGPVTTPTVETTKEFVNALYTNLLGRGFEDDSEGLDYWTNVLINKLDTPANVVANIVLSDEGATKTDEEYVTGLYASVFGRTPDAEGLAYWLGVLTGGEPRLKVARNMINSAEFGTFCANFGFVAGFVTLPNESVAEAGKVNTFVDRIYQVLLNRGADVPGITYWTNALVQKDITPVEFFTNIALSDECLGLELTNDKFVDLVFRAAFGRDAESDYWHGALDACGSRADVVAGILACEEFEGVCAQYGLK